MVQGIQATCHNYVLSHYIKRIICGVEEAKKKKNHLYLLEFLAQNPKVKGRLGRVKETDI